MFFYLDEDNHWGADLFCGHTQHVRHNQPWQQRKWVLSDNERNDFIGFELDYKSCKVSGNSLDLIKWYLDFSSS